MSALKAPNIPPEIVSAILSLAEFMEHYDKALPIDIKTLGNHAESCHAYAKALHYKELEFMSDASAETIEKLIKQLRKGSFLAEVADIQITWNENTEEYTEFVILHD